MNIYKNNYDMSRIKYNIPPLVEVIFQLRFPTILSLNSQSPVVFQEKIREKYPYYRETTQEIRENKPDGQSRLIRVIKNHEFVSKDRKRKINLEGTFIAFSTHSYTVWEDYLAELKEIIELFESCYNPSFYTRIGLRYVDVIQRSKWGLLECKWSELIKPTVLGFMTDETDSYSMNAESKNKDGISSTKYHFELAQINGSTEKVFLIDCDYFVEKAIEREEFVELSHILHKCSSNFIQASITNKLHEAMLPVII